MATRNASNPWTTIVAVTWGTREHNRVGAGRLTDLQYRTMDPMGWHDTTQFWDHGRSPMMETGCGISYSYGTVRGDGIGNVA